MSEDIGPQGLLDMVESELTRELRLERHARRILAPMTDEEFERAYQKRLSEAPLPCNVDTGATPVAQRGKLLEHGAQYEIHNKHGQPLMYWDGHYAPQRWAFDGFTDTLLPLTPATGPMKKTVVEDNGWTPVRMYSSTGGVYHTTTSTGMTIKAYDPPPSASNAPPAAKSPVEVAQSLFDELPASEPEKPQSVVEEFSDIRRRMEEIRRSEGRQAPA